MSPSMRNPSKVGFIRPTACFLWTWQIPGVFSWGRSSHLGQGERRGYMQCLCALSLLVWPCILGPEGHLSQGRLGPVEVLGSFSESCLPATWVPFGGEKFCGYLWQLRGKNKTLTFCFYFVFMTEMKARHGGWMDNRRQWQSYALFLFLIIESTTITQVFFQNTTKYHRFTLRVRYLVQVFGM